MIGISILSTLIAIGNNIFSVQVGEGVARDLREALFSRSSPSLMATWTARKPDN